MKIFVTIISLIIYTTCLGQDKNITGIVVDKETQIPLKMANVIVLGTIHGTITNTNGHFELSNKFKNKDAVVSYSGYNDQTINLRSKKAILVELEKEKVLLPTMNIGLGDYTGPSKYIEFDQKLYEETLKDRTSKNEEGLMIVEQGANFYGGINNLYAFLATKFEYPKKVLEINQSDRVILEFTVAKDGIAGGLAIVKGNVQNGVNEQLEKVFSKMPKWYPASQRGQPVDQNFIAIIIYNPNRQ